MLNVLIIGAGNKGALADIKGTGNEHKYLSYAHAVNSHESTNLLGFIDVENNKVENAIDIWGGDNLNNFPNLKDKRPDIIIIATNDSKHFRNLHTALSFSPKLVICEKPIFTFEQITDGKNLLHLYEEQNIPILVNYTRKFINHWQDIKINLNDYGKFIEGYLFFNAGWEHTASHFVNFVNWFKLDHRKIHYKEVDVNYKYIYQWGLIFENNYISESIRKNKIDSIYDNNTFEVICNAYNYVKFGTPLICTGEEALETIITTRNIMEGVK